MSDDINWKLEEALRLFLDAVVIHHVTVPAKLQRRHFETALFDEEGAPQKKILPSIVIEAAAHEQIHPVLAAYRMQADVTLYASADQTTDADFQSWKKNIEDVLNWDELPARLSELVPGFKCDGIQERYPGRKIVAERHWESTFSIMALCQKLAES